MIIVSSEWLSHKLNSKIVTIVKIIGASKIINGSRRNINGGRRSFNRTHIIKGTKLKKKLIDYQSMVICSDIISKIASRILNENTERERERERVNPQEMIIKLA